MFWRAATAEIKTKPKQIWKGKQRLKW